MENYGEYEDKTSLNIEDFKYYREFHNSDEADNFIQLLEENDILYSSETTETLIDATIVGTGLLPKVIIKLLPEDFKKVNTIINNHLKRLSFEDIKDHYLNQLDDQELIDILHKPDEWSIEDSQISKIILKARNVEITDEEIRHMRKSRLNEMSMGKSGTPTWMFIYFLCIPLGALFGENSHCSGHWDGILLRLWKKHGYRWQSIPHL